MLTCTGVGVAIDEPTTVVVDGLAELVVGAALLKLLVLVEVVWLLPVVLVFGTLTQI
jgi:hypothetical protein